MDLYFCWAHYIIIDLIAEHPLHLMPWNAAYVCSSLFYTAIKSDCWWHHINKCPFLLLLTFVSVFNLIWGFALRHVNCDPSVGRHELTYWKTCFLHALLIAVVAVAAYWKCEELKTLCGVSLRANVYTNLHWHTQTREQTATVGETWERSGLCEVPVMG